MKTYIWNTDQEVYVVNADSLEQAKHLLRRQFSKDGLEELLNKKDKHLENTNNLPSYVIPRVKNILSFKLESLLEIWNAEPDYILNNNEAVIYSHVNE